MKRAKQEWVKEKIRNSMREKIWNRIGGEKVLVPLVIERISNMRMYEDFIILKEDNDLATIFAAYASKYGTPRQVCSAIEERLCKIGRSCFGELVRKYCDHVSSPEALSFALDYGVFSTAEINFIERKLDHGETLSEFRRRSWFLVNKVITELTKVRKIEKPKQTHSALHEHDVCADGAPCCTCC